MTYQEFFNKWNGKPCEMGGSANAIDQCVDLANAWIREGCGEPMVFGTNAIDFPSKISNRFEFIKNTLTNIPKQGDLMIYDSPDGIGHIDIFDNGDDDIFYGFSQNWPIGSKCQLVKHIYIGTYKVIGWLHFKGIIETMTEEQKRILEFIGGRTEGDVREAFGALTDRPNLLKQLGDAKSYQDSLQFQIGELNVKLALSEKNASDWQSQLKTANKTNQKLSEDLAYYQPYKALYEKALKNTIDKYTAWELISLGIKLLIQKSK